jgi:L-threonate 2-dehydrogenase
MYRQAICTVASQIHSPRCPNPTPVKSYSQDPRFRSMSGRIAYLTGHNVNTTISVISPGNMGAAIAQVLSRSGVRVLTTIEGRSEGSAARARAAGMELVAPEEIVRADFILSILPPSAAVDCARRWGPLLAGQSAKPVYVDCNAISPRTALDIAGILSAAGTPFVDAGIIGLPPSQGTPGPRIYASGEHAARFADVGRHGLDIRPMQGPIGAASALKLSFAGINKGITVMAAAMILAAERAAAGEDLRREIEEHWPLLWELMGRRVLDMPAKAYRWVGEMREIAEFSGDDPAAREIYSAAADLFERIAQDTAVNGAEVTALRRFFQ